MIKYLYISIFFGLSIFCTSLNKGDILNIEGIIYDMDSKNRIGGVTINSTKYGIWAKANIKGEFNIRTHPDDTLIVSVIGYHKKKYAIRNRDFVLIKMKVNPTVLNEVIISDKQLDPAEKYRQIEHENKEFLKKAVKLHESVLLAPLVLGISITAIYDYFSKQGKYARRFERYLEWEKNQALIEARFNEGVIYKYTKASEKDIKLFMHNYRPALSFIVSANEFELRDYIIKNFKLFKLIPDPATYPELKIDKILSSRDE